MGRRWRKVSLALNKLSLCKGGLKMQWAMRSGGTAIQVIHNLTGSEIIQGTSTFLQVVFTLRWNRNTVCRSEIPSIFWTGTLRAAISEPWNQGKWTFLATLIFLQSSRMFPKTYGDPVNGLFATNIGVHRKVVWCERNSWTVGEVGFMSQLAIERWVFCDHFFRITCQLILLPRKRWPEKVLGVYFLLLLI